MRPTLRMSQPRVLGPVLLALGLSLSGATTLLAQTQADPAKPASDAAPTAVPPADQTPGTMSSPASSLPVDVEHIRRQAEKQPAVKLDEQQLRFYVLVVAKQNKIDDF